MIVVCRSCVQDVSAFGNLLGIGLSQPSNSSGFAVYSSVAVLDAITG
jgi:hypothetical protein